MRSRTNTTNKIGTAVVNACGLLVLHGAAFAAESEVPEPFRGFDDSSAYTINYDDLSELLNTVVLDVGRSKREVTPPARPLTGTRMKTKIKRFTEREANRFFFETFIDNEAGRDYVRDIQSNLEQLPAKMPLENFSRDEQLAYWLNLYNVTVLNEVLSVYPKRSLEGLLRGRKSILSEKLLTVAEIPLSLDDIQNTILKYNYGGNPLVLYGLYQGVVGGPNIRRSAYTGADVYIALEENAFEFVNSNRGTFTNNKGGLRVARFYDQNEAYFVDFDSELAEHLSIYLEDGPEREQLHVTNSFVPNIEDWTVTDLGGTDHEVGGSFSLNDAALLDAYRGPRRADGSILVASVIVKKKPRVEEEPQEVTDAIEELKKIPAEKRAATVEEITAEDVPPAK